MRTVPTFFLIFFLTTGVGAAEFGGFLSTGVFYDSNTRSRHLPELFLLGRKASPIDAIFISTSGEAGVYSDTFDINYSLFSRAGVNEPTASTLDNYLSASYFDKISESLRYDIFLLSHYALEDYTADFHHLFVDTALNASLYFEQSNYLALFSALSTTGFAALHDDVRNLSGAAPGIEFGCYIYPKKDANYILVSTGATFYFLRPWVIRHRVDNVFEKSLRVPGRFVKISAGMEFSWMIGPIALIAAPGYLYTGYFKEDVFTEHTEGREIRVRHINHSFSIALSANWKFADRWYLTARYTFTSIRSSIGRDSRHYADLSYLRHLTGMGLKWEF